MVPAGTLNVWSTSCQPSPIRPLISTCTRTRRRAVLVASQPAREDAATAHRTVAFLKRRTTSGLLTGEQLCDPELLGAAACQPPARRVPLHVAVVVVAQRGSGTRTPASGPASSRPSPSPSMRGCGTKSAGVMPSRRLNAARRFWMRSPQSQQVRLGHAPSRSARCTSSSHGSAPVSDREHAQPEAVHRLVRVASSAPAPCPCPRCPSTSRSISFFVGGLGQRELDVERLVPRSRSRRCGGPGVGSAMYVTPISEVKRGSWYAGSWPWTWTANCSLPLPTCSAARLTPLPQPRAAALAACPS